MTRISPKQVASLFEPQIILIKPQKRKQPELSPASLDIKRIEEKERSQKRRTEKLLNKPKPEHDPIYININNQLKDIYELKLVELKQVLKDNNVKNISNHNKDDLIDMLKTVFHNLQNLYFDLINF